MEHTHSIHTKYIIQVSYWQLRDEREHFYISHHCCLTTIHNHQYNMLNTQQVCYTCFDPTKCCLVLLGYHQYNVPALWVFGP